MKKNAHSQLPRHPNAIKVKEALGYMFGDLGNLLNLTFVSTYLKVFYTDCFLPGHNVSAARISTDLTVLFLVIRFWDAINDPLWGLLVDRRRPSKNGKFRPYTRSLAFPLAASVVLCFLNIHLFVNSYALLLAFAYVTYCIYGMMYTGMNIPYGSLASAITDDPDSRTLLSTTRSIGGGVGGAAVTLVAQKLIYDDKTTLNPHKTFIAAVILASFAAVSYILCFYTTKERVQYSPEKKKLDLKLTYGTLFKSRPFLTVTGAGLMISGLLQFGSFNQYLTKNYFGNSDLSLWITISTYAPMVALILFMPKIAKKFGKKEITTVGLALATAASLILSLIGPRDSLRENPMPFILCNFGIGTGYSFLSILTWAIVADVIDYQEKETGIKNESAIYAVYTFARKVGQTIADSGGLQLLYKYAKYDPDSATVVGYIPGVGDRIYKMVSRVMFIAYGITFIMFLFYPLNKKKLAELHSELDIIREKRMQEIAETKNNA
ncbi:MAG: MFS transporter [Oscillospiraceae bacterium]|nr:MFS transporter [Oscillospiraceae bacterium]